MLSLGVMEHWNDSGWLQVVISITAYFLTKGGDYLMSAPVYLYFERFS